MPPARRKTKSPQSMGDSASSTSVFTDANSRKEGITPYEPGRLERLFNGKLRRWLRYEFCYSSLERCCFAINEFEGLLQHTMKMPLPVRLTKKEWSAIRKMMSPDRGPRRLSKAYLNAERAKLREEKQLLRSLQQGDTSTNHVHIENPVPHPLQVGMLVTAVHPLTKCLEKGKIRSIDAQSTKISLTFQSSPSVSHNVDEVDIFPHGYLPLLIVPPARFRDCIRGLAKDGCSLSCWTLGNKNISAMQYLRPREDIEYRASSSLQQGEVRADPATDAVPQGQSCVYTQMLERIARYVVAQYEQLLEQKRIILRSCREIRSEAEKLDGTERKERYHTEITWLLYCLDITNCRLEDVAMCRKKLDKMRHELEESGVRFDASSSAGSSEKLDSWQEAKVEALIGASRWSAAKAIPDVVQQISKGDWELQNSDKRFLDKEGLTRLAAALKRCSKEVSNAANILFVLLLSTRWCTNMEEVGLALDTLVERMKPRFESNYQIYQDLQMAKNLVLQHFFPLSRDTNVQEDEVNAAEH